MVYEYYNNKLPENIDTIAQSSLLALHHLHYTIGCVHGAINPDSFVFDGENVKLSHWALNAITNCGALLDATALLPSDVRFLPPEQVKGLQPLRKSDVWSLALFLLTCLEKNVVVPKNPAALAFLKSVDEVFNAIKVTITDLPDHWQKFFRLSLEPKLSKRANVVDLLQLFDIPVPEVITQLDSLVRFNKPNEQQYKLTVKEVYHLYCLANPIKEDNGKNKAKPPILSLPPFVLNEGISTLKSSLSIKDNKVFIPDKTNLLNIEKLQKRMKLLNPNIFYPLILTTGYEEYTSPFLPLIIRENDFNYQCERMMIFKRLVEGSPFMRAKLLQEARIDISPLYRGEVWASVLNAKWSDYLLYDEFDKTTPTATDRQISVDIPRCHQYNDLLASPQGHKKLTRILKAWLYHNESNGYVYWQGLDSLASPFVLLNFNNEPQAFACFNAFINKYLRGFFQRDNSAVIQEYLSLFTHLIAFHDPQLYNHLIELGFMPDLYAIPWFLTMFTHVLPLHKIMHVWDTLLLGNDTFPLCIGAAILRQLRNDLLHYSFNDCILIFSDLPEINIEQCVKEAVKMFCSTPRTSVQRNLIPLHSLKEETAPRIHINELVNLVKAEKTSKLLIIDRRNEEDILKFGAIRGAFTNDFDLTITNGHLVIVVNDIEKSKELVRNCVPRVCSLIVTGYIPNELL